jgi:predicted outer membrane repeat protein
VFTANTAGNHGGGLHCESGSVVARDCVFAGNAAGSGAGAWVEGPSRPRFLRCVFEANNAFGMGGAVATDGAADLQLTDCEFLDNVGGSGGAVCVSVGTATIRGCTISRNVAEFGGGVCMMSAAGVHILETTVELSEAAFQGGGLYASDSTFDVSCCSVSHNDATIQGGAAWMLDSTASFSRCEFRENWSGGAGDAFYVDGSGVVVVSSEFVSNGVAVYVQGYGRAPVDARWNWWGESSGPHHLTANPLGTGDEITGGVSFNPWNVTASCDEVPSAIGRSWTAIKASYR